MPDAYLSQSAEFSTRDLSARWHTPPGDPAGARRSPAAWELQLARAASWDTGTSFGPRPPAGRRGAAAHGRDHNERYARSCQHHSIQSIATHRRALRSPVSAAGRVASSHLVAMQALSAGISRCRGYAGVQADMLRCCGVEWAARSKHCWYSYNPLLSRQASREAIDARPKMASSSAPKRELPWVEK